MDIWDLINEVRVDDLKRKRKGSLFKNKGIELNCALVTGSQPQATQLMPKAAGVLVFKVVEGRCRSPAAVSPSFSGQVPASGSAQTGDLPYIEYLISIDVP